MSADTLDESLSDIIIYLGDIRSRALSCHDINEALGYSPLAFFQKLHVAFGKCWNDTGERIASAETCNVSALIAILDFVRSILPLMSEYQTSLFVSPILPDIVQSLGQLQAQEPTEGLLKYLVKFDSMVGKVQTEIQNAVLNTNDSTLLAAIKQLSKHLPGGAGELSITGSNASQSLSKPRQPYHEVNSSNAIPASIRQPSFGTGPLNRDTAGYTSGSQPLQQQRRPSGGKLDLSSLIVSGKSQPLSVKGTGGEASGAVNNISKISPRAGGIVSGSITPRALDVSFIPHSIAEQWLLANNAEELALVLFEIGDLYTAMDAQQRKRCRADIPKVANQLHVNLSHDSPTVVSNALKVVEILLEDHCDEFLPQMYLLFPKLKKFLSDHRSKLRVAAFRVGCLIMTKFPLHVTEQFLIECLDSISSNVEVVLKMASVALFHNTVNTGDDYTSSLDFVEIKRSDSRRRLESGSDDLLDVPATMHGQSTVARRSSSITARTVLSKMFQKALVLLPRTSAQPHASSTKQARSDPMADLAVDVIAIVLFVVCPKEVRKVEGLREIPDELLRDVYIGDLSVKDALSTVKQTLLSDIFKHAKNVDYPTFLGDETMSGMIQFIVSQMKAEAIGSQSSGTLLGAFSSLILPEQSSTHRDSLQLDTDTVTKANNLDSIQIEGPEKLFTSSGRFSPIKSVATNDPASLGDEHDDRIAVLDSPWNYFSASTPSNKNRNVDPSKLSSIKRGKRSGNARAHSANVGNTDGLTEGIPVITKERLPNTSAGIRSVAEVTETEDGQRLPINQGIMRVMNENGEHENSTGRYVTFDSVPISEQTPQRRSSFSLRRRQRLPSADLVDVTEDQLVDDLSDKVVISPTSGKILSLFASKGLADTHSKITFEDPNDDVTHHSIIGSGLDVRSRGNSYSDYDEVPNLVVGSPKHSHIGSQKNRSNAVSMSNGRYDDNHEMHTARRPIAKKVVDFGEYSGASISFHHNEQTLYDTEYVDRDMHAKPAAASPKASIKGRRRLFDYNNSSQSSNREIASDSIDSFGTSDASTSFDVAHEKVNNSIQSETGQKTPSKRSMARSPVTVSAPSEEHLSVPVKVETYEYLSTEDIHPSNQPSKELARALNGLETHDWPEIFHTLNSIRRIGLHHQSVLLASGCLHSVILGLVKQIDNLRSTVAKNALLALGDLFQGLGRQMDSEIAAVIPNIIKRFGDSNGFLIDSAEMALHQMIEYSSKPRALNGLLLGLDHKNAAVRGKVSALVSYLMYVGAEEVRTTREFDNLKTKLSKICTDQSPEARASGRDMVRLILDQSLMSKGDLESFVPPDIIAKALKEGSGSSVGSSISSLSISGSSKSSLRSQASPMKRITSFGIPDDHDAPSKASASSGGITRPRPLNMEVGCIPPGGSLSSKAAPTTTSVAASTPSRAKAATAKRIMDTTEELHNLQGTFLTINSGTWIEKKDAIQHLTDALISHTAVLKDAGKLETCIDNMIEKLDDGSVKVILFTISCFERLNKEAPSALSNSHHVLIPALVSTVCSSNKQISAAIAPVMHEIFANFPVVILVQKLSIMAVYEKDRVRSMSFKLLADGIGKFFSDDEDAFSQNGVVRKSIFPAIANTLSSSTTKPDIRMAAIECLRTIYRYCNKASTVNSHAIWQWTDDKKQQDEIRRILTS